VHKATESALDTMERGLVQMKDYQAARRKLESRRLAYDSVLSKVQKMRKEDVRTEEELRSARAKYEETSEDVHNRMTAIQEAEVCMRHCSFDIVDSLGGQTCRFDRLYGGSARVFQEMHRFTNFNKTIMAVNPSLVLSIADKLIPRTLPSSQITRSRSRSTAQAHAYTPDITEEPVQIDVPRPVISTKYKNTTSSSKSSPVHGNNTSFLPAQAMPSSAVHPTAFNPTSMPTIRRAQTDSSFLPPRPHSNGRQKRKLMRVEYAFEAESDSEMSISPGETVSVIEEVDPGWFIGEIVGDESRQGMFPATYCTVIDQTPGASPMRGEAPAVRRSLKPPSPTKDDDLDEQVSQLSLRRPATTGGGASPGGTGAGRPSIGRAVTASPTPAPATGKKKPPPPAPRGSKPMSSGSASTASTNTAVDTKCRECGCDEFRANVFKKGSCNNCFHVHISV